MPQTGAFAEAVVSVERNARRKSKEVTEIYGYRDKRGVLNRAVRRINTGIDKYLRVQDWTQDSI